MDSYSEMTVQQVQEALADEKHPRHEEAKRLNAQIADAFDPVLQKIRGQLNLNDAFKPILDSLEPMKKALEPVAAQKAKLIEQLRAANELPAQLRERVTIPDPFDPLEPVPVVTPERIGEVVEGIRQTQDAQRERDTNFLEAFQSLGAKLDLMSQQNDDVARTNNRFNWATIIVGVLTLGATILFGIVSQSS